MLQTAPISWDREAEYRLPVSVVARGDGPPLPRRSLAAARPPGVRRPACLQGRARSANARGRRSSDLLGAGAMSDDVSPADRRRRALRGLRAVALPPVVAEEPAALHVRRRLSGGLRALELRRCKRQVLLEGEPRPRVEIEMRFLHVVHRQCCGRAARDRCGTSSSRSSTSDGERVRLLGSRPSSARSASERRSRSRPASGVEPVEGGAIRALLGARCDGELSRRARAVCARVSTRVTGRGRQHDPVGLAPRASEAHAARTFCSAHVVLRARTAPSSRRPTRPSVRGATAEPARATGLWPVLVGARRRPHTMLASPIILSDYPRRSRPRAPATSSTAARSTRCSS